MKNSQLTAPTFIICIKNTDFSASLERMKLYKQVPDAEAQKVGLVRVIDESGEDYLYPQTYFLRVRLVPAKRRRLAKVARQAA